MVGKGKAECNTSEESEIIMHKCKICEKVFRHKVWLERHKTVHTESNPLFNCEYCERSYSASSGNLIRQKSHS